MSHGGSVDTPVFKIPKLPLRIQRALPCTVMYHPEHCMPWSGPLHRGRTPVTWINKKRMYTAHLLWERFHQREMEPYSRLRARCKNRFCVNPHHQHLILPTKTQRRRVEYQRYSQYVRPIGAPTERTCDSDASSTTELSEMTESETEADIESFVAKD